MRVGGSAAAQDRLSIRERILRACEDVLREEGPAGLTVRRVTDLADVSTAAVNYSFGSKEAMVAAVLQRLLAPLAAERIRLLEEATACERVSVAAIVSAFVAPVARLEPWHRAALALLLSVEEGAHGSYEIVSSLLLGAVNDRFEFALSAVVHDLSRRELRFRMKALSGVVLLWALDLFSIGTASTFSEDELITVLVAGIEAPATAQAVAV